MPKRPDPVFPAITLGDPAGVGPELALALFGDANRRRAWQEAGIFPFVVGSVDLLHQWADFLHKNLPQSRAERFLKADEVYGLDKLDRGEMARPGLPVWDRGREEVAAVFGPGQLRAENGRASRHWIEEGGRLIQSGQAHALVTGPIHKEALQLSGCPFPGHTELLAHLAGDVEVAMLLVGGGIRAALATIHEPLRRVPELISRESILGQLRLMHQFIPWFGLETPPRLAVTGLNPHASDGGLFGDEEERIICPAIAAAQKEGIQAEGPFPADTVFHFHREGQWDAVLAMYHDQALIPVKTLAFHDGVNVTMGLPFIRTSVDHGTAFNIAGQGTVRVDSLVAALETALVLLKNRFF